MRFRKEFSRKDVVAIEAPVDSPLFTYEFTCTYVQTHAHLFSKLSSEIAWKLSTDVCETSAFWEPPAVFLEDRDWWGFTSAEVRSRMIIAIPGKLPSQDCLSLENDATCFSLGLFF